MEESDKKNWFRLLVFLIVLSVLQLGEFLIFQQVAEDSRIAATIQKELRSNTELLKRLESQTYLSISYIAVEDWDSLLANRTASRRVAQEFENTLVGLLRPPSGDSLVAGLIKARLEKSLKSWAKVQASQIALLRSTNRKLKDNKDIESFKREVSVLKNLLEDAVRIHSRKMKTQRNRFENIAYATPVIAFFLTAMASLLLII